MDEKTDNAWRLEYEEFITGELVKLPTETRLTYSYEQWLIMSANNAKIQLEVAQEEIGQLQRKVKSLETMLHEP